ncbi:hypothetical protein BU15DRAFT_77075 [Melanogaster broomeanus]|nr:hypothetical protein BU15DRAFT_77075 [Melanogaster broomeanus]
MHTQPRAAALTDVGATDPRVALSVLESTDNDQDRALDILLGMNDPSYTPPVPPKSQHQHQHQYQSAPSSDSQRASQEELDEQLARRLALEEEQTAARSWGPQNAGSEPAYQSYQSRRGGSGGGGGGGWGDQPGQGQGQWQGQGQAGQGQAGQGQAGQQDKEEIR